MKKLIAMLALASCMLGACNDDDPASAKELDSLRALAGRVPVVARGTPNGELQQFHTEKPPNTRSTMVVAEVLKGTPGASVFLWQEGTAVDAGTVPDGAPLVESGTTYWLFLQGRAEPDTYELVDGGLYRVSGDDAVLVTDAASLPRRLPITQLVELVRAASS